MPETNPFSKETGRTTMTQPNVYWTLVAPFVTVIGLYSNVPAGGRVDDRQVAWLHSEMQEARKDSALIVTMHHPPTSCDSYYGGSEEMLTLLDAAMDASGRAPDVVLAGHVHNYQRFTRTVDLANTRWEIPYIVAGAGGYWHLHTMAADARQATLPWPVPNQADLELVQYVDNRHGFGRVRATEGTLHFEYLTVARPHESWSEPPNVQDSFTLDVRNHTLGSQSS